MENNTLTARIWNSRAGRFLAPATTVAIGLGASSAFAQETTFDTSKLESTSTAVLGVGALIAVGFAVFKIGKRAMNRI